MRLLTFCPVVRRACAPISTIAVLVLSNFMACSSWAQSPNSHARTSPELPMPVVTATTAIRDVPAYLKSVGTAVASKTAIVKSEIRGELMEIDFTAGREVQVGDILARLDSSVYQEQLDRYLAIRDYDEALLANKSAALHPYLGRASQAKVQLKLPHTQNVQVNQLKQSLKSDEARVAKARSNLDSTKIRSPISGVTSKPLHHLGNVVTPADNTGLVIISQIEPISVVFALPEIMLPVVQRQMAGGHAKVRAYGEDKVRPLAEGHLVKVDNESHPKKGMVEFNAMFSNKDRALLPGMLLDIQVQTNFERDALSIPVSAIQHSNTGYYVYMVTENQTAHIRPISVGTISDGFAVVRDGIWPGDIVVTDGQYQLTEGSPVSIIEGPSTGAALE